MKAPDRFSSSQFPAGMHIRPEPSIRVSEIISALSYALDLTEGQPMGHSVRACIIGMRLAADRPAGGRAGRSLLCPASEGRGMQQQLLPAVSYTERGRDSRQARRENDGLDARGLGKPALCADARRHGLPFLQRMRRLFQVAATQQQDSCDLVKIRCERGAYIAKQLGFSDASCPAFTAWTSTGTAADIRTGSARRRFLFSRASRTYRKRWTCFTPRAARGGHRCRAPAQRPLVRSGAGEGRRSLSKDGTLWNGLDSPDLSTRCSRSNRSSAA